MYQEMLQGNIPFWPDPIFVHIWCTCCVYNLHVFHTSKYIYESFWMFMDKLRIITVHVRIYVRVYIYIYIHIYIYIYDPGRVSATRAPRERQESGTRATTRAPRERPRERHENSTTAPRERHESATRIFVFACMNFVCICVYLCVFVCICLY